MKMCDFINKKEYFKEKYFQKDKEYIEAMKKLKVYYCLQDLKGRIIKYFGLENKTI